MTADRTTPDPAAGHRPLTVPRALALAAVLDAAGRGARVARLLPGGEVVTGTARHLVTDERSLAFPGMGEDVRDCLLRVTGPVGEWFWPVAELAEQVLSGEFVPDYVESLMASRATPEPPADSLEVDGLTFDNVATRDAYLAIKALPEDRLLYLARSEGRRLKQRHDPTYLAVAGPDTNPDWVTGTAAEVALLKGWLDNEEYATLTAD